MIRTPHLLATLFAITALFVAAPRAGMTQESGPAGTAQAAIFALQEAGEALAAAEKSRDRVAALTQTVQAYEAGLEAVREGLRQVTIREAAMARAFEAERERLATLLGALQSIEAAPAPATLLHPNGPVAAVRAGMLVSSVVPALKAEADRIRQRLDEAARLRALEEEAARVLENGLESAQKARTELSQAMSDRVDLPRRYADDPETMAVLIASAETLGDFTTALEEIPPEPGAPAPQTAGSVRGSLALPVQGRLLRDYLEPDAAGITRPGLIVATRPLALVTAPLPATVRYAGPLLDYGNVVILEPSEGVLFVLAGLGQVFVQPGEVIAAGAPLGHMGGRAPDAQDVLIAVQDGNQTDRTETLYIEVRESGAPVDPMGWFAVNKE